MRVNVGVSAGAVLAVAGVGAVGFMVWKALQGWDERKRAIADLWAAGGQRITEFAAEARDPYSVQGVIAYGGAVNPIARTAASFTDAWAGFNGDRAHNEFARAGDALATWATGREETVGGWLRSLTSDDDERIRDMLAGTTAQNAARADVARVEAASTGGASGGW